MVRYTQTILRLLPTNCSSVFDHFVGLVLNGLSNNLTLLLSYDWLTPSQILIFWNLILHNFILGYSLSNFHFLESHIAQIQIGFEKCFFFF